MDTVVLGAGGQLGSELVRLLPDAVGLTHADLSVSDRAGVDLWMHDRRPQLVFNCAAFNAVDRAETEPELARQVNAGGAVNVALACASHGVRLIHFSTNFVFDGSLDRPYVEADVPRPLGVYGRSKHEGEIGAFKALPGLLVIRTAAVFGDRGSSIKGGSFPERILEKARKQESLRVVSDQTVNPTYARDLAAAALELAATEMRGLVHVAGGGCCSWYDFALAALAACGVDAQVEPVTSAEIPAPASRPPNGCLGSTRTRALRPWREGLGEWAEHRSRSTS